MVVQVDTTMRALIDAHELSSAAEANQTDTNMVISEDISGGNEGGITHIEVCLESIDKGSV